MKLSALMSGKTPSSTYEGFANNDDFVLAIDTLGTATGPADYNVVQSGVKKHEGTIDTETKDSQYIRTGKVTNKTGAQRTFKIEGDRYHGDAFQDWALSLDVLFGTGSEVVRKYVYFSILTGVGEQGSVAVIVNDTASGDAGENAGFSCDMKSTATPTAYTYSAS